MPSEVEVNPENMNILSQHKWFTIIVMAVLSVLTTSTWAAYTCTGEFGCTGFTNIGSIANTRHNMTQSTATPNSTPDVSLRMDGHRNNYGEVCVYCHTPHGSQTLPQMPLWNRTVKATTYTVYNSASLTQTVSQPGGASLTCLSCHDGQTAIDSVINMPGSGMYLASQATGSSASQSATFLNTWTNASVQDAWCHATLSVGGLCGQGCLTCHGALPMNPVDPLNFKIFITGTDLTNDHPVGVTFPAANGPGTDWNTPAGMVGSSIYFDTNSNSRMDKAEIRTYEGKVECASCHDPHGVPSAGPGSMFNPTFLRVSNAGSAVCLTCHAK